MTRLPIPGGDKDNWGTTLNDFLSQSIDGVGSLKPTALIAAGSEMVANKNQPDGYPGLDSAGLIATAQLPTTGAVAAYMGVYADLPPMASGDSVSVSFDDISAQLDPTSISWDSADPDYVTILQTGVYSVTAGVYWRDSGNSGPISLQIISSCQFNFADIRPGIGDGATESQQFLTVSMYLQAGHTFRVNIQQTLNVTVTPYIEVLVTRCA
jgi:hypothetical protein